MGFEQWRSFRDWRLLRWKRIYLYLRASNTAMHVRMTTKQRRVTAEAPFARATIPTRIRYSWNTSGRNYHLGKESFSPFFPISARRRLKRESDSCEKEFSDAKKVLLRIRTKLTPPKNPVISWEFKYNNYCKYSSRRRRYITEERYST